MRDNEREEMKVRTREVRNREEMRDNEREEMKINPRNRGTTE